MVSLWANEFATDNLAGAQWNESGDSLKETTRDDLAVGQK